MGAKDDPEVDQLQKERNSSPRRLPNQDNSNERDASYANQNALPIMSTSSLYRQKLARNKSPGSGGRGSDLTIEAVREFNKQNASPPVVNPNSSRQFIVQEQTRAGSEPPRTPGRSVSPRSGIITVLNAFESYNDAADEFGVRKSFDASELEENYTNLGCCSIPQELTPRSRAFLNIPDNVVKSPAYEGGLKGSKHIKFLEIPKISIGSSNTGLIGNVGRSSYKQEQLISMIANLESALQRERELRRMTEKLLYRKEREWPRHEITNPVDDVPNVMEVASTEEKYRHNSSSGALPSLGGVHEIETLAYRRRKLTRRFGIELAVLTDTITPNPGAVKITELCNPNNKARLHSRCFSSPPKETRRKKRAHTEAAKNPKTRSNTAPFETPPLLMEFFYLTAISVKLKLAKDFQVEPTVGTPTEALWDQAQNLNLPFTDFYDFLMASLAGVYWHLSNRQSLKPNSSKFLGALETLGVLHV